MVHASKKAGKVNCILAVPVHLHYLIEGKTCLEYLFKLIKLNERDASPLTAGQNIKQENSNKIKIIFITFG